MNQHSKTEGMIRMKTSNDNYRSQSRVLNQQEIATDMTQVENMYKPYTDEEIEANRKDTDARIHKAKSDYAHDLKMCSFICLVLAAVMVVASIWLGVIVDHTHYATPKAQLPQDILGIALGIGGLLFLRVANQWDTKSGKLRDELEATDEVTH